MPVFDPRSDALRTSAHHTASPLLKRAWVTVWVSNFLALENARLANRFRCKMMLRPGTPLIYSRMQAGGDTVAAMAARKAPNSCAGA